MATSVHRNTTLRVTIWNLQFLRLFLGYHYLIHSLYDLYLGVKEIIFKGFFLIFTNDQHDHAQAQELLLRWSWNLHLNRPIYGHDYYIPGFSDLCLWVEKFCLTTNIHFIVFTPKYLSWGWRSWNLQLFVSLPNIYYISIFFRLISSLW